jgi:hypothetical protein
MADFARLQAENNRRVATAALLDLTKPTTIAPVGVTLTAEHTALLQSTVRFTMSDKVRKDHCSRIQKIIKFIQVHCSHVYPEITCQVTAEEKQMGDGITVYKSEVEILYNKLDSNMIVQAYISSSTVKSTDPFTGEKVLCL